MKIKEAFDELARFQIALSQERPKMKFNSEIVRSPDGPFKNWCDQVEVPGENASNQSGVYFISDLKETILYIGKAGANNLGAEIWGKFSGATNVDQNDTRIFRKSSLAQWAPDDKYRNLIIDGDVLIRATIISPKEHSSLAEVYLHVWCVRNGGLPVLNKRIG